MKDKLRDLLDKTYELEGLVHLALKREDLKEDFLHLIAKKGKSLATICESFDFSDLHNPDSEVNNGSHFPDEYSIDEEETDDEEIDDSDDSSGDDRSKNKRRGKLVFTINERYRFKKELFDGSDADFNNTLALVASMEDFDEAEEYFISEEGFNMRNPVVREFMDIIKKYFK